jgi:uncharacterized protein (DUF1501 family)
MPGLTVAATQEAPILVAVELSGGNDGLNSVVPYGDDAYYQARPTIGIAKQDLLVLDDHYGLNPGMEGLHKLWQDQQLAIIHGCGYEQPSFSHFTSMAYWHTAAPNQGRDSGWVGRLADVMSPTFRDEMIVNIGASQSLAVNSKHHTPLVFDDPTRFARHQWMGSARSSSEPAQTLTSSTGNPTRDFLRRLDRSAQQSSEKIRNAWANYQTDVDYGIAPMDLPKVAACIAAGLPTQLYYVSFRNNAFDTHVNQPPLHRRLLSYACDGIFGFLQDIERIGRSREVVVMVFSEFGRRVPENANLGTDHGTANAMFLIGKSVKGGHYGDAPSLTDLTDGDNLIHTTDFRSVYATAIQGWLGVDANQVLGKQFDTFNVFA